MTKHPIEVITSVERRRRWSREDKERLVADQRNVVLVGGTGTGKSHLAIAIARALIRNGTRGRFFNVVDLVNRLKRSAASSDLAPICGTARVARAFSVDLHIGTVRSYVRPLRAAHGRWP